MSTTTPHSHTIPLSVKPRTADQLPDLDGIVKAIADSQNRNRSKVARAIGMDQTGMLRQLKGRNPRAALIMALSEAVQFNLFDMYMRQLPEHLRATTETRQLEEQMAKMQQDKDALQQEFDLLKRERDLLLSLLQGSSK